MKKLIALYLLCFSSCFSCEKCVYLQEHLSLIDFYLNRLENDPESSHELISAIKYHVMKCNQYDL